MIPFSSADYIYQHFIKGMTNPHIKYYRSERKLKNENHQYYRTGCENCVQNDKEPRSYKNES